MWSVEVEHLLLQRRCWLRAHSQEESEGSWSLLQTWEKKRDFHWGQMIALFTGCLGKTALTSTTTTTTTNYYRHGTFCSRKIKVVLIGRLQVGSRDSSREAALRIWRPFSISFNLVLAGPPLDYRPHQDLSPACLSLLSYPWSSSPEKWSHYTPGKISYHIQVKN